MLKVVCISNEAYVAANQNQMIYVIATNETIV
jgi:hypothetical protein